jgi:hypothetical protein
MLAEGFLHALVPSLVVTVQAVRVDAVEDFHAVTGPLGHLRARSASVQPPGHPGVPEVIGLAGQRRGNLRRGERHDPGLLEDLPERGRLVNALR